MQRFKALAVDHRGQPIKRSTKPPVRKTEWKITYQRAGWSQPQVRVFQMEFYARRFVQSMRESEWEYGTLIVLRVDRRDVGPWMPWRSDPS